MFEIFHLINGQENGVVRAQSDISGEAETCQQQGFEGGHGDPTVWNGAQPPMTSSFIKETYYTSVLYIF